MTTGHAAFHAQFGFSYIEVLVAIALIALTLVPAMQALQVSETVSATHAADLGTEQRLSARMEEMLARPYATLDGAAMAAGNAVTATLPAPYSDTAGTGTQPQILVTVYRYDGANATGNDYGLLWVKVFIDGSHALNALASR
jgi:type II secretory pathway component PulJ